jgi:hypothetical protein
MTRERVEQPLPSRVQAIVPAAMIGGRNSTGERGDLIDEHDGAQRHRASLRKFLLCSNLYREKSQVKDDFGY